MSIYWLVHPKRSKLTYLHFEPIEGSELVYLFGVVSMAGMVNGVFDKGYARDVYQQATKDGYRVQGAPSVVCRCETCSHYRIPLLGFSCGWCLNTGGGVSSSISTGELKRV